MQTKRILLHCNAYGQFASKIEAIKLLNISNLPAYTRLGTFDRCINFCVIVTQEKTFLHRRELFDFQRTTDWPVMPPVASPMERTGAYQVGAEVDAEDGDGAKGKRDVDQDEDEERTDLRDVARQRVRDRLLQVVEDQTTCTGGGGRSGVGQRHNTQQSAEDFMRENS